MPHVVNHAPGDIRSKLWTLYWLARFLAFRPQSDVASLNKGAIVELGVRKGDSTRALLCALEDVDNGSVLFSYDIEDFSQDARADTKAAGIPWPMANWAFSLKNSIEAGQLWQGGLIDLVFVDTDHTLATTQAEIAVWSPHVRVGGCMAFHDYWLADAHRECGVKPAVDEFFGAHPGEWNLECHDAGPDGDTGFAILWKIK